MKKSDIKIKISKKDKASSSDNDDVKKINTEVYKQNFELAIVNKTLSLLRKLYQISLLEIDPSSLSEKISDIIRNDLNMEMVGILSFDAKDDSLLPFSFSKSKRLADILKIGNLLFKNIKITNISQRKILKDLIDSKNFAITNNLRDVWDGLISADFLKKIEIESHLKTIVLYPLITPKGVIGILIIGLNREYKLLNDHEKDSMKSFIDVVAVALDKAYLYKELQDANEKLKGLDKLKTEFLSLAAHQLRSPLTAIKGYTSMMLEGDFGDINEKAKEAIDRVYQSSQNLTIVVEDLLNVSKIESGGMKYDMIDFDFSQAVSDVVKNLSVMSSKKGLQMNFESDPASECMIHGDKDKINQVILNLIDNSVKYTKSGTIDVSVRRVSDKVLLKIKDTGVGMTPEIKATLFEKFARGEGARMNTSGSGLGLYLVRQITEAHGGRSWVESPGPNLGSTFFVELNAKKG